MNKKLFNVLISSLLIFTYICIQYLFPATISSLSNYASYYFDIIFITVVWAFFTRKIDLKAQEKNSLIVLFIFFIFGISIHYFAIWRQFIIPFDMTSKIVLIFLLLLGPILEELVFRYAFWESFSKIWNHKIFIVVSTATIFSFSHFYAYYFVPSELRSFIIYQTIYTFLLGLALGFYRQKSPAILSSILYHMAFNLGFYLVRFL